MDDRIQRALDGELPADRLTPPEREELHRYHATICTALEPLERLASVDVTAEVMERIEPGPFRRGLRAMAGWLWTPRPLSLSVRPALALGGALALAAVVWQSATSPAIPHVAAAPARVIVQFRLADTEAREVSLVGDFNGWRPEHRLHRSAGGVWSVDVALEPGVYNYVFVVDGESWRLDPLAPQVTDGFGGASSRVAVLAPEVRS